MAQKRIVALGGDGVGPEVVGATCHVLEDAFNLEILKPPAGEDAHKKYNNAFPDETRQECDRADAILFGATGPTSIAVLAYLRWVLDNFVNVRPMKFYTGARSCLKDPTGLDLVILRENSEGMYSFFEGDLYVLREGMPELKSLLGKSVEDFGKGKFAIRLISERGAGRMAAFACQYALQRKKDNHPGKVTCVTKSNVLMQTDGLFERIVNEEVQKHPELSYNHYYVDDMSRRLLVYPEEKFDVVVTTNMYGDILADEAAELVGGLGMAPSANVGGRVPYFESVHGSAPDIAGKNIVNPTATILSAKLMLDYLDMRQEADALERAVAAVYRKGENLTRDQGGTASTMDFAQAVLNEFS
jgi:3-isopropylmalate dehydrogenase